MNQTTSKDLLLTSEGLPKKISDLFDSHPIIDFLIYDAFGDS